MRMDIEQYEVAKDSTGAPILARRWWINDRILVGGAIVSEADGLHLVNEYGIGAVINLQAEAVDPPIDGIPSVRFPIADDGTSKPVEFWAGVIGFGNQALGDSRKIYVHCAMGGSRSPAGAYALLRTFFKRSPREAVDLIRESVPTYGAQVQGHLNYINSCEHAIRVLGMAVQL
jgi:hypothetical protein